MGRSLGLSVRLRTARALPDAYDERCAEALGTEAM